MIHLQVTDPSQESVDFEYWLETMRCHYENAYSLELHKCQSDLELVPGKELVVKIQSAAKADPKIFYTSAYQSILNYLNELRDVGAHIETMDNILEFGVGYARLLRQLFPFKANLHGCDVTPETIEWCNRHLSGRASFNLTRFQPPLPYLDGMFDFIFANSVFTHVQKEDTEAWVVEMHRIIKPGGHLIITQYDLNEHLRFFSPVALDKALRTDGYITWGNPSVKENNIYFTPKTLEKVWGKKFTILMSRPHFLDQSHLVMRRD